MTRRGRRGATLIEVLVGCGVFTFLMLSSIAIMNMGTGGWRAVEAKADVTRQLNRFEADITQELKRASLATVGVYTPTDDYRWAVWMKTAMNAPGCYDSNGLPTSLGDPLQQVTNAGKPVLQRYVLFYITRMDAALHAARYGYVCSSYSSTSGPDTTCPHKWIVKKDIWLLDGKTTGADTIGQQGDAAAITRLKTFTQDASVTQAALVARTEAMDPSSLVHRAQIVAENILSFEVTRLGVSATSPLSTPQVDSAGPIILFDLKAFKALDASKSQAVGQTSAATVTMTTSNAQSMVNVSTKVDAQGTTTIQTNSSVTPTFGAFTVQLDNRVVPQNP